MSFVCGRPLNVLDSFSGAGCCASHLRGYGSLKGVDYIGEVGDALSELTDGVDDVDGGGSAGGPRGTTIGTAMSWLLGVYSWSSVVGWLLGVGVVYRHY